MNTMQQSKTRQTTVKRLRTRTKTAIAQIALMKVTETAIVIIQIALMKAIKTVREKTAAFKQSAIIGQQMMYLLSFCVTMKMIDSKHRER